MSGERKRGFVLSVPAFALTSLVLAACLLWLMPLSATAMVRYHRSIGLSVYADVPMMVPVLVRLEGYGHGCTVVRTDGGRTEVRTREVMRESQWKPARWESLSERIDVAGTRGAVRNALVPLSVLGAARTDHRVYPVPSGGFVTDAYGWPPDGRDPDLEQEMYAGQYRPAAYRSARTGQRPQPVRVGPGQASAAGFHDTPQGFTGLEPIPADEPFVVPVTGPLLGAEVGVTVTCGDDDGVGRSDEVRVRVGPRETYRARLALGMVWTVAAYDDPWHTSPCAAGDPTPGCAARRAVGSEAYWRSQPVAVIGRDGRPTGATS